MRDRTLKDWQNNWLIVYRGEEVIDPLFVMKVETDMHTEEIFIAKVSFNLPQMGVNKVAYRILGKKQLLLIG